MSLKTNHELLSLAKSMTKQALATGAIPDGQSQLLDVVESVASHIRKNYGSDNELDRLVSQVQAMVKENMKN